MASSQFINVGAFVPTTSEWDIGQLQSVDVTSVEFKELLVRLYQNMNTIALSLNIRDAGYYPESEFINGQLYFPASGQNYRQVYRKVIDFGVLPNTGTKSVAHGIDMSAAPTQFTFTRMYATASDTTNQDFIPIPYAAASGTISLSADDTNVYITTTSNRSSFDTTYVVLEYLKQ
jgi:hypothetical protein